MKYEKPMSVDMGRVAPVMGATCSPGTTAGDGCTTGDGAAGCPDGVNPTIVYACPGGSTADTNCYPNGGNAGQTCNSGTNPDTGW